MPDNKDEFAVIIEPNEWIEFRYGVVKDITNCSSISISLPSLKGYPLHVNIARLIEAAGHIVSPLVFDEVKEKIKTHKKILKLLESIKSEPRDIRASNHYIEKFKFKSGEYDLYSIDADSNTVFVGNRFHYARYKVLNTSLSLIDGEVIDMTNEEEAKLHYASLIAIRTATAVFRQRLYEGLSVL